MSISFQEYCRIAGDTPNFPLFKIGDPVLVQDNAELALIVASTTKSGDDTQYFKVASAYDAGVRGTGDVRPVAAVVVDGRLVIKSVRRALCATCQVLVTVPGHSDRCVPRTAVLSEQTRRYRLLSWLGDSVLATDVRAALIMLGTPAEDLEQTAQRYVNNEALAAAYDSLALVLAPAAPALGPSVRQRATAFEASYAHGYRREYLRVTFPRVADRIDGYIYTMFYGPPDRS